MLKQKNFDYWDGAMALLRPWTFYVPDAGSELVVASVAPTTLSVGDSFTLVNSDGGGTWLPMPTSLYVDVTEASGTDLGMTIEVSGMNQFGELISETLVTAGGGDKMSSLCYARVDKVVLKAITAGASGDRVKIGFALANAKYGLPTRIRKFSTNAIQGNSGDYRDTVKGVYKNGADISSSTTVDPHACSVKAGTLAADDVIQVVFGPPHGAE